MQHSATNHNRNQHEEELERLRARVAELEQSESDLHSREAELQQSNQFLNTIINSLPVFVFALDQNGAVSFSEGKGLERLSLTPEQLKGNWLHTIHDDTEKALVNNITARFLKEEIKETVKMGNSWYDFHSNVLKDEAGNIKGAVGVAIDVTEYKQAEFALYESENKYRQIFELEKEAVFLIEQATGLILDANTAATEIYGYTKEEFLTLRNTDISAQSEETKRLTDNPVIGSSVIPLRYHRRKNGTIFPTELSMRTSEWQGKIVFVVAARDISEQINAETALRESEKRFRNLFDTMTLGVVYQDANGLITDANPAAERILGLSLAQMQGRTSIDPSWRSIHEDGSPFPGETHPSMQALETGQEVRNVVMGVFNSAINSPVWININAVPQFREGEAKPYRVYATFEDITERKLAEEALRESEQRMSLTFNNTSDMITLYEVKEGIPRVLVTLNESMFRVINRFQPDVTLADVVGKDWRFLHYISGFDEEYIEKELAHYRRAIELRQPYQYEYKIKPAGQTFYGEATLTPVIDEGGNCRYVLRSAHDITERKKAEQALRKREQEFKALVENSPDIISRLDKQGLFLYANPPMAQIINRPAETLIGTAIAEQAFSPKDKEKIYNAIITLLETGREGTVEFSYPSPTKGEVYYQARIVPEYSETGEIESVLTISRDITSLRDAQDALVKSQEQLFQAQKLESVGRLAGGIAHDFNNILTAIIGYANLLSFDMPETDPSRVSLLEIETAANRAASLTRQLLAFSRRQMLQPKLMDLNYRIQEMGRMLKRLIGEDIILIEKLAPDLGKIKADPVQIEQVILNLVINAKDAMPNGGKVELETNNIEVDEAMAKLHSELKQGPYVLITVSDNGYGMDEAVLSHIFEPFFTTKELGKGTGLGLATVYGIIRQSEGMILVDSQIGVGTTFRIYLPRFESNEKHEPVQHEVVSSKSGSETILLVEDEELVRRLGRTILSKKGFKVLEAANGKEALEICRQYKEEIHLLISDVVMPEMGGLELIDYLHKYFPKIKLMLMSGYSSDLVEQVTTNGKAEFIQKPFTPTVLLNRVREVLDKK